MLSPQCVSNADAPYSVRANRVNGNQRATTVTSQQAKQGHSSTINTDFFASRFPIPMTFASPAKGQNLHYRKHAPEGLAERKQTLAQNGFDAIVSQALGSRISLLRERHADTSETAFYFRTDHGFQDDNAFPFLINGRHKRWRGKRHPRAGHQTG